MWVTDMRHLLGAENFPGSRRLAQYFGAIVAAVTAEGDRCSHDVDIKCRRRPERQSCNGFIQGEFEAGTRNVIWRCSVCGDRGLIHHWQGTWWDKGGRPELPEIHRVTYRYGLLPDDDLEDLTGLTTVIFEGSSLSREIVVAIYDNELLGAAGEYGDPLAGDPLEYDELIMVHAGGTTNIVLYNRGIMLFTTNEEFYKRVHRVAERLRSIA
jgi:hypothetical protein